MWKTKPINGLIGSILFFVTTIAYAGIASDVLVTRIAAQSGNTIGTDRVCIYVSGDIVDTPQCNDMNRLCTDINKSIGRAHLAIALTAYTTQRIVRVQGLGTCNLVTNSEDLEVILLEE